GQVPVRRGEQLMTAVFEPATAAPWDVTGPIAPAYAPPTPPPAPTASPTPATFCPPQIPDEVYEPRRNLGMVHQRDVLSLVGAAIAAIAATALLFTFIAPLTGHLGFVVMAFVFFLGFYALLVSTEESGPAVRDRVISALIHGIAFLLFLALVDVIGFT